MNKPKWTLGYNFYSTTVICFNAADINDKEIVDIFKSNTYQIYLITKRKKFFFQNCEQLDGYNLSNFYFLNDTHDKEYIPVRHGANLLISKSEKRNYYHVEVNGKSADHRDYALVNDMLSYRKISGDTTPDGDKFSEIFPTDLEVMYVGQSFGSMQKRLKKHEKIKEVALSVLDESSNEEVLIICLSFDISDNSFLIVDQNTDTNSVLQDFQNLRKKAAKRVSKQQQVTIFEACLIKYFQPQYNIEYKETFPAVGFTSYDQIYNTDFDYVAATIVIPKNIGTRLWSQHIQQPAFTHSQHYPLSTQDDKRSLFDFIYKHKPR